MTVAAFSALRSWPPCSRACLALLSVAALVTVLAGLASAEEFRGKVVGVADGDTISVLHDGRAETIRLNGIDAPEDGQAFSNRAKQFASGLAFGQVVTVRAKELDRYGRTVADVILPDGRSLSHEIVRAGFAWWFRRYSTDQTLAALEAEARSARRGLWADANPVPPWEWRQAQREPATAPNPPAGVSNRRGSEDCSTTQGGAQGLNFRCSLWKALLHGRSSQYSRRMVPTLRTHRPQDSYRHCVTRTSGCESHRPERNTPITGATEGAGQSVSGSRSLDEV